MLTKTYDPDQYVLILGGIVAQGFSERSVISITMNDSFTDVTGVDGEVSRSKNMDRTATVSVSLMQTSSTNLAYSGLSNGDRLARGGAGIVDFAFRDLDGVTLYASADAWISKEPDVNAEKEATERVWTIRCGHLNRVDGGA